MRIAFMLFSFLIISGCYQIKNFHEIDKGKFFRSAQLNGKEFAQAIEDHGIKTIINLRGESDSSWFREEAEVARRYNVNHINIRMSAQRLPHREDLIKLLDAFRDAERPILIHCQAGADRTGEAAFIYQVLYMGKSKTEALKMQTPRYLHLEQKFPAKRYFTRDLWQGEEWARNVYNPCSGEYRYYNTDHCADPESEVFSEADDT